MGGHTHSTAEMLHAADDRFVRMIPALDGIRQLLDLLKELVEHQKRPAVPERLESMRGSTALLGDVTNWANGVTYGITGVIDHALLSDEADFLWDVSADILNRHPSARDPEAASYQRLSSVLLLEEDPEVGKLRAALRGHTPPA